MSIPDKVLSIVLVFLCCLFCFSVLKHISYPLLWQDEAETAMYAKRIIQFGYPKVHDGKNTIYQLIHPNPDLGVDKKTDAFIGSGWGMYYFAAIGVALAENVNDIYQKTALVRMPFSIIGILGILIFAFAAATLFIARRTSILLFLVSFILLELFSISLTLHLREVRYYSLVIFLSACLLFIYIHNGFIKKWNQTIYGFALIILLFLIFNTFYPLYIAFFVAIFLYESINIILEHLKEKSLLNQQNTCNKNSMLSSVLWKKFSIRLLPLLLSLFSTLPLFVFYNIFDISQEFSRYYRFDILVYYQHITRVVVFFHRYEFLYIALTIKIVLIVLWKLKNNFLFDDNSKRIFRVSNFLSLLFVISILVISRIPSPMWERYVIVCQPILMIILLLDAFIIWDCLGKRKLKIIFAFVLIILAAITPENKIKSVEGHAYELFHQYQGPLDYLIPFIKSKYEDTRNLVIATNYEEYSYMYYLDSRITIGSWGYNLKEDLKILPDIIIFRKGPNRNPEIFNEILAKGKYRRTVFPVYDYPVNNIPELILNPHHLFKTPFSQNDLECVDIYLKETD